MYSILDKFVVKSSIALHEKPCIRASRDIQEYPGVCLLLHGPEYSSTRFGEATAICLSHLVAMVNNPLGA